MPQKETDTTTRITDDVLPYQYERFLSIFGSLTYSE
jgi:hypothetical protein